MEKDCSLISLFGSFNNDNLPIYGMFKVNINIPSDATQAQSAIGVYATSAVTIKSVGGGISLTYSATGEGYTNEVTHAAGVFSLYLQKGVSFYLLMPKYTCMIDHDTSGAEVVAFDVSDFAYKAPVSIARYYGVGQHVSGDYASLVKNAVFTTFFKLERSNIYGNVSNVDCFAQTISTINMALAEGLAGDVSVFAPLTGLEYLIIDKTGFVGNIESLGTLTNLACLSFGYTSINGSLEGLARGFVSNGKESGTIQWMDHLDQTLVTFNGERILVTGNRTLTWAINSSDNTKIDVTYNNETVTISRS
jgi:hypothetical protein